MIFTVLLYSSFETWWEGFYVPFFKPRGASVTATVKRIWWK